MNTDNDCFLCDHRCILSNVRKPFIQTILFYDDESRPDHNERSMEECLSMCAWSRDHVCTYQSCK